MDIREKVKENLAAIKKLLFEETHAEEQKFEDHALADGTAIVIDPSLGEGSAVYTTVEGAQTALPDGEYVLADGTGITVVEGKITAITAPEEMSVEEQMSEVVKGIEAKIADSIAAHAAEVKALTDELQKVSTSLSAQKENETAFRKEMFALLEKLAEAPAAETPPAASKHNFNKVDQNPSKNEVDKFINNYLEKVK